jgi:hypothetical protein
MSDPIEFLRKDDILAVLRRSSVPEETLHALGAALPDPVGLADAANGSLRDHSRLRHQRDGRKPVEA